MGEARRKKLALLAAIEGGNTKLWQDTHTFDANSEAAYNTVMKELIKSAFDSQGFAAFECSKESAAIHEAGHCIIYASLGTKIDRCYIDRDAKFPEIWVGASVPDHEKLECSPSSDVNDDLYNALCVLSGVAAELKFCKDFRKGSSLNEIAIFGMICVGAADKLGLNSIHVHALMFKAVMWLLEKNASAHHEISKILLEKERLNGKEISSLVRDVVAIDPASLSSSLLHGLS